MTFPPEHFDELTKCYAAEGKTVVAYRMTDPGFPPWEDQNYPRLEVDWVYTALTNGASHA